MSRNVEKGSCDEVAVVDDIDRQNDLLGSHIHREWKGKNGIVNGFWGQPDKILVRNSLSGEGVENDFLESGLQGSRIGSHLLGWILGRCSLVGFGCFCGIHDIRIGRKDCRRYHGSRLKEDKSRCGCSDEVL